MKIKTVKQCLDYCSDIEEYLSTLPADCNMVKTGIMFTLFALRLEFVRESLSKTKCHAK